MKEIKHTLAGLRDGERTDYMLGITEAGHSCPALALAFLRHTFVEPPG
eukprot:SAG11_NODE_24384_length_374_cov_0.734545_1_plen_47_part_10